MNATPQYLLTVDTHSRDKPVRAQSCRDSSFNFFSNQMQGEAPIEHEGSDLLKQFISVNTDSKETHVLSRER